MQIDEHTCSRYGGCDYRKSDCFDKISSLINAFSQFDTVELGNIRHGSYITTRSVLNSNRLRVSSNRQMHVRVDNAFANRCKTWLNYKAPNWSQPTRELCVDVWLNFREAQALLHELISVGFLWLVVGIRY